VLRGLSIVFVVLHHTNLHMMFNHVSFQKMLPVQAGKILFWNGANGVTVFFAISGFLITTNAMRRWGGVPWGSLPKAPTLDFYRLRFARIAPLLVILLCILSCLHLAHAREFIIRPERATLPRALLAAVTFHVNWLESARGYLPANWDVLWSLSVEEMFYLFFPLLCRWTKGPRTMGTVLIAFAIIGPFARTVLTKNDLWADYGYLSCMDAIAFGCLAAMLAPRLASQCNAHHRLFLGVQAIGAMLMVLVMAARPLARWLHLYQTGLDVTALALGTSLMLMALSQQKQHGSWPTAPLRWFGRNSYEVYLTHMFVVTWGVQLFVAKNMPVAWTPFFYLAMLLLAGLLGAMVARWYSEPLNRRLRRGLQLSTL
jgi:peptidoglycan/LPS O-acetylase OafA/YrhL